MGLFSVIVMITVSIYLDNTQYVYMHIYPTSATKLGEGGEVQSQKGSDRFQMKEMPIDAE